MKVAVIIPDRNDRPEFLKNCLRMLENQTLKPELIHIVNFEPTDEKPDITKRYRKGYEFINNHSIKFDLIALIENDDWYAPNYLEEMVTNWELNNRPDIFGTNYTIYYHLRINAWFTMNHKLRSSAMSTVIKPNLKFEWCDDNEVYTDIHIWQTIQNKKTFEPKNHICLGIKHGEGLCGGRNHKTRMDRYINKNGINLLANNMDLESFKFYTNYFK